MKFEDIIGHEEIVDDLMGMIKSDRINHALLFDGIGGVGKKYTAKVFANALLCESEDNKPCGVCDSCIQFSSNTNPDYLFITPDGNSLKKSDVMEVLDFLSIKPFESKLKVVLIEHFDKATPEAQNSMLKTLEEPPEYGRIIILSQNTRAILDTVLSRLKTYKFHPISGFVIIEYLVKTFGVTEEEATFYADYSNGSIGKAVKIINDEDFRNRRKKSLEIFDKGLKSDNEYVYKNLSFFDDEDESLDEILDLYLSWLKDLMIFKKTNDPTMISNKDFTGLLNSEKFLKMEILLKIRDNIIKLKKNLKYNVNSKFAIELFFIDLMEECKWQT